MTHEMAMIFILVCFVMSFLSEFVAPYISGASGSGHGLWFLGLALLIWVLWG